MGVVTAAMLERMGCRGRLIALYGQSQPSMDAVSVFVGCVWSFFCLLYWCACVVVGSCIWLFRVLLVRLFWLVMYLLWT